MKMLVVVFIGIVFKVGFNLMMLVVVVGLWIEFVLLVLMVSGVSFVVIVVVVLLFELFGVCSRF